MRSDPPACDVTACGLASIDALNDSKLKGWNIFKSASSYKDNHILNDLPAGRNTMKRITLERDIRSTSCLLYCMHLGRKNCSASKPKRNRATRDTERVAKVGKSSTPQNCKRNDTTAGSWVSSRMSSRESSTGHYSAMAGPTKQKLDRRLGSHQITGACVSGVHVRSFMTGFYVSGMAAPFALIFRIL